MGKAKAPPAPDYSGIAAANQKAADNAFVLGQQQLEWAKAQYADQSATTNKVVDSLLSTQAEASAAAAKDRARYETVFQPLEDQYVQRAIDLQNPARMETDAAKAAGDVSQQYVVARENARSELEKYGVDPSQTRAAALDLGTRTAEAAARAGAANQSRQASEARSDAMLGSAVSLGKGYPAQVTASQGISTGAGQGAVSSGNQTFSTGSQAMGTPTQYTGLGMQGLSGWSNALTSGYNAQLDRYKAQNSASSGLGSLLGLGVGIGAKALTGGLFEEGGEIPSQEEMQYAVDPSMHTGIHISKQMSPSGGQQTDDVAAQSDEGSPLRLNVGEFVMPEDTLRWYGEEKLQKMIQKGREDRAKAVAQPKVGAIDTGRSQEQAINTRG